MSRGVRAIPGIECAPVRRGPYAIAEGNSIVTVRDAAGTIIATVDPTTRQRTDLRGRVLGTHDILSARDSFVHMLLRKRQRKASTAEFVAPKRPRGRPRKDAAR